MITKKHPGGFYLAAFYDASSFFAHNKELSITSDPHKMLNRLGVTSRVEINYILPFKQHYSTIYTGTDWSTDSGDKLAILTSVNKW